MIDLTDGWLTLSWDCGETEEEEGAGEEEPLRETSRHPATHFYYCLIMEILI